MEHFIIDAAVTTTFLLLTANLSKVLIAKMTSLKFRLMPMMSSMVGDTRLALQGTDS